MGIKFSKKQIIVADSNLTESGFVYPHSELSRVAEELKDKFLYGTFVNVDFKDPQSQNIDMSKVAIKCENFDLVGNSFVCDFEILDTVYGVTLQSLIQESPFVLCPVGYGKVNANNEISEYEMTSIWIKMT